MKKIIFLMSLFSLGCLLPIQDVELVFEIRSLRSRYKRADFYLRTLLVAAGLRRISASNVKFSPKQVAKINSLVRKQSKDPLTGATNLGFDFTGIKAKGLSLGDCNFFSFNGNQDPLLRAVGSELDRLNLENTKLPRADFTRTKIKNSNMRNIKTYFPIYFDFTSIEGTNFSDASLKIASFQGAWVQRSNFENASLPKSNWEGCHVFGNSSFKAACLKNSNLKKGIFRYTDFSGTNLRGSNLSEASFYRIKANGKTDVTGSCFAGVSKEHLNQFRNAIGFKSTHTTFAACYNAGFKVDEKKLNAEKEAGLKRKENSNSSLSEFLGLTRLSQFFYNPKPAPVSHENAKSQ